MTDTTSGTYTPFADEPAFDMDDEEIEYSRGPFLFLVALVVLAAFGGVVYVAYQQGMRQGQNMTPPLIVADPGPIRVAPKDPGGLQEPYQDTFILNGADAATSERLAPVPEEPIERPVPTPENKPATVTSVVPENAETIAPVDVSEIESAVAERTTIETEIAAVEKPEIVEAPVADPIVVPEEVAPVVESTPAPVIEETPVVTEVAPVVEEPEVAAIVASEPEAVIETPAPAEPAVIDATSGNYVVQTASVKGTLPDGQKKAVQINRKHGDLLTGLGFDIKRADLGDKGVYYRVRIGPFEERSGAIELCEALKGQGQDCFVTKP